MISTIIGTTARTRHHYIPIVEAQAGMVLFAPADAVGGGSLLFSLPQGHALTEDNLHQLRAHHVEYIFVSEPDDRPEEAIAVENGVVAGKVLHIFHGADMADPTTATLFEQVLAYRRA
jgi:hypothetical protein